MCMLVVDTFNTCSEVNVVNRNLFGSCEGSVPRTSTSTTYHGTSHKSKAKAKYLILKAEHKAKYLIYVLKHRASPSTNTDVTVDDLY